MLNVRNAFQAHSGRETQNALILNLQSWKYDIGTYII